MSTRFQLRPHEARKVHELTARQAKSIINRTRYGQPCDEIFHILPSPFKRVIDQAYDAVVDGTPFVKFINGAWGSGKSTLIRQIMMRVHNPAADVPVQPVTNINIGGTRINEQILWRKLFLGIAPGLCSSLIHACVRDRPQLNEFLATTQRGDLKNLLSACYYASLLEPELRDRHASLLDSAWHDYRIDGRVTAFRDSVSRLIHAENGVVYPVASQKTTYILDYKTLYRDCIRALRHVGLCPFFVIDEAEVLLMNHSTGEREAFQEFLRELFDTVIEERCGLIVASTPKFTHDLLMLESLRSRIAPINESAASSRSVLVTLDFDENQFGPVFGLMAELYLRMLEDPEEQDHLADFLQDNEDAIAEYVTVECQQHGMVRKVGRTCIELLDHIHEFHRIPESILLAPEESEPPQEESIDQAQEASIDWAHALTHGHASPAEHGEADNTLAGEVFDSDVTSENPFHEDQAADATFEEIEPFPAQEGFGDYDVSAVESKLIQPARYIPYSLASSAVDRLVNSKTAWINASKIGAIPIGDEADMSNEFAQAFVSLDGGFQQAIRHIIKKDQNGPMHLDDLTCKSTFQTVMSLLTEMFNQAIMVNPSFKLTPNGALECTPNTDDVVTYFSGRKLVQLRTYSDLRVAFIHYLMSRLINTVPAGLSVIPARVIDQALWSKLLEMQQDGLLRGPINPMQARDGTLRAFLPADPGTPAFARTLYRETNTLMDDIQLEFTPEMLAQCTQDDRMLADPAVRFNAHIDLLAFQKTMTHGAYRVSGFTEKTRHYFSMLDTFSEALMSVTEPLSLEANPFRLIDFEIEEVELHQQVPANLLVYLVLLYPRANSMSDNKCKVLQRSLLHSERSVSALVNALEVSHDLVVGADEQPPFKLVYAELKRYADWLEENRSHVPENLKHLIAWLPESQKTLAKQIGRLASSASVPEVAVSEKTD
jgi:hypothetical protein